MKKPQPWKIGDLAEYTGPGHRDTGMPMYGVILKVGQSGFASFSYWALTEITLRWCHSGRETTFHDGFTKCLGTPTKVERAIYGIPEDIGLVCNKVHANEKKA